MTDYLADLARWAFGVENALQGVYASIALMSLMVVVPPLYLMIRGIVSGGIVRVRRPRKLTNTERLHLAIVAESRETGNPYQSPLHS